MLLGVSMFVPDHQALDRLDVTLDARALDSLLKVGDEVVEEELGLLGVHRDNLHRSRLQLLARVAGLPEVDGGCRYPAALQGLDPPPEILVLLQIVEVGRPRQAQAPHFSIFHLVLCSW